MKLESFPYIQAIQINDCFAIKDTHIQIFEKGEEFRHLILTGKNGSGKTTILNEINSLLQSIRVYYPTRHNNLDENFWLKNSSKRIETQFSHRIDEISKNNKNHIFSLFKATRIIHVQDVTSPIKEDEIIRNVLGPGPVHSSQTFSNYFKHYLVNKKIAQAFLTIKRDEIGSRIIEDFFTNIESTLKEIFRDDSLKLKFIEESYDFKIIYGDNQIIGFDQLSSGFSALLDIISELIVQTDLIRKSESDFTYNPLGIVLIDEPENHAHLAMQEQILPLLTTLFPKVQFIVATHSPAVIASIKNATVFDLSSKQTFREGLVGSSYSQLMIKLFGLNNQYSTLADQLLNKVNTLLLEENKEKAKTELQKILTENLDLLSPSLYLEIESAIHLIQD